MKKPPKMLKAKKSYHSTRSEAQASPTGMTPDSANLHHNEHNSSNPYNLSQQQTANKSHLLLSNNLDYGSE